MPKPHHIVKPLSCSSCPFMRYRKPRVKDVSRFRCKIKQSVMEMPLFNFETDLHKKCPAHKRGGTLYVTFRRKKNNKETQEE